ncbi:TPA: hemagglutinin repeat-containing protein [Enterobacter cancerogenus]|uniref:hemagglutinin repeat-containing protein n=1 Tax=Enterobacter cancerogenus TaxID=69218 RepID=UPI001CA3FA96|nr:hemagglutinin repeat-containing protein [Enterobacter cancerogenus]MDT7009566.1 hemagglutinin repeat-containing protein [Enterobacter cancerogenus]QZY36306.1 hemagglutinin repeat-containing protein [Enterobacter cancerogenus]WNN57440.1 hemagglutinin repeat-containing protein [Enterobacter cancerogenus]
MEQDKVRFSQRALSILLSALIATQPLLPAVAATITPSGTTQMDKAANGVPVVNIATPNQSGISHNKYNDYNVGKEGLILNNATGKLNQTQLGGLIQNNPNLKAGQEAKGIINEVTGSNRSQLQGYTEVAGKAANVIVANPYGITCNGCGFINTPNATLTTGKPVLDANGKMQSLDVTKGAVTIEGAGLDGSQSNAVSIISRATEINAGLYAKELKVIAGANRVAADGSVSALKGEGLAPKVAVDTGALGGMYANRIHLVSSEKGLGVNLGNLNARQGDISLDASGKLVVNNSLSSGAFTAKGQSLTLTGDHKAGGDIVASGQETLVLNGAQVSAGQDLQLSSSGVLSQNSGSLFAGRDTTLSAKQLTQSVEAQAGAGRNLAVAATGTATFLGKNAADKNATLSAGVLKTGSSVSAANNLSINATQSAVLDGSLVAGNLLSAEGGVITQRGNLSATDIALSGQSLAQESSGKTNASGNVTLKATGNAALNGSTVAGKSLSSTTGSLNTRGSLSTGEDLLLNTGDFTHGGTLQGKTLRIAGTDITSTGSMTSGSTLEIDGRNVALKGDTGAKSNATIVVSGKLDNSGKLVSDDTLSLHAAQLNNSGTLSGAKGLTATVGTLIAGATSVTHSDADITLNAESASLAGETSAGGKTTVHGDTLHTATTSQLQGRDVTVEVHTAELNGTQTATGNLTLSARDGLTHAGKTSAGTLMADSTTLTNSGVMTANSLRLNAPNINNSGLLQGQATLSLVAALLDNQHGGMIYSPSALSFAIQDLRNAGIITSDAALSVFGAQLTNSGELSGKSLALNVGSVSNASGGLLLAQEANAITVASLTNAGTVAGNSLSLKADRLDSRGLLQGDTSLTLTTGILNLMAGSRSLTNGALTLSSTALATAGQVQGKTLNLTADNWQHGGTLLATGALKATVADALVTTGDIMSQGNLEMSAASLDNRGSLLSASDVSLSGASVTNSGVMQGDTLTARADTLRNSGTLTGIAALTLASRLEMATPLLALTNNSTGALLTSGNLTVFSGVVNNAGQWQGQKILLTAGTLNNTGAIQAESSLNATLTGNLTSGTGSKITSNGSLALSAMGMTNAGQWIAKNLTLTANTLANSAEITGVDALDLTLAQRLENQARSKLLSAGALTLNAGAIVNAGQIQGSATRLTGSTLDNSGRVQGDALSLNASDSLNNATGGVVLSQNRLDVTSPVVVNQGTLQGGDAVVTDANRLQNDGNILSANTVTLNSAEVTNGGLIQAVKLLVVVVKAINTGRFIATESAELRGTTLTNSGTLQGAGLLLDYRNIANSGTVLGISSLGVNSDEVNNSTSGRLFSAGDLFLESGTLRGDGQIVALGDVALKLVSTLTHASTLAAGKTLAVTSQGDITNTGVMQGNGLAINAGGKFTNSGQLTAGNASSTFSAQSILLNAAGSLSAGGDVMFTSLSDMTVNGFTGTAGSLTMAAAGTLLNTALIYAANNIRLYADRIHNVYGDILAGNSLGMQKDAAGAANSEVVNTSGNIETQQGDITIKTAYLLNERDGSHSNTQVIDLDNPAWVGNDSIYLSLDDMDEDSFAVVKNRTQVYVGSCMSIPMYPGACSMDEPFFTTSWRFTDAGKTKRFAIKKTEVDVTSSGNAARIASGNNVVIAATMLDNNGSNILANHDVLLQGEQLNNQSYQASSETEYLVYSASTINSGGATYVLSGREIESDTTGAVVRAVIQAGGNITANFTRDISNTLTTANTDGFSNTLSAPTLNTLSNQTIASGDQAQSLISADILDITTPQWRDAVTDALKDLSGGGALENTTGKGADTSAYPLPSGNNGYFVPSSDPDSPYLITVNPKLDGLGQLDAAAYGDLYALLGMKPGDAPRETNSAFTDQNQFLGSSYFLDRLGLNPDRDYRFLGDAAFDTRYVSNAVLNQTGSRYINGIGSDLEQMRYLMDRAAAQQQTLGLQFGVALTAAQVAALDSSLLWWEASTINGQTVMVPKVYLSPKDVTVQNGSVISGNNVQLAGGNITNSGSTLAASNQLSFDASNTISNLNAGLIRAGGNLNLSAIGDINNIGSTISGKTVGLESLSGSINNITRAQQWNIDAGRVNFGGTDVGNIASITATDGLAMRAGQDINITGANVSAGGSLGMTAGNDINISANEIATSEGRSGRNRATTASSSVTHQGSTLSAGDDLTLQAGNDVNARAAAMAAGGDVGIQAGRDVNLLAEASSQSASSREKKKTDISESVRQQGTEVASGGNTVILAGRDVTAQAAEVTAQGDIGVAAGRDVILTTVTESDYHYKEQTKTKKGFLSKKTTHTIEEDSATREKGSLLSGDNVTVSAGNNLLVKGSAVAGDGDMALSAGNNVDIVAATNTDTSWRFKETKKSGLMGTGGIGFTIGSSKTTHDLREQGTTQSESFSTVGSTGGNVSITAGKQAHIGGADIIAQKDISLTGDSVVIEPGHDKRTRDETFEQKSSGLTVALSGAAGSAVNNAVTTAQSAKQSSDSRLAVLQGTQAALSGVQAGQAVALDQAKGDSDKRNNNTIGISASIGSQSSKSSSHMESETTTGSTLSAGNNVTIKATGSDITVAGSQIKAGKDVMLDAARDVNLIASQDTHQTTGKNSSSGGSLGVGVGVGSGGAGISISANANSSKGHEKGNGVWQNETTVDAGNRVTINTGRDATIAGAQVSGDAVVADIGRDLTIASTQDSDHYNRKQNSVSGGVGYTFGAGTASGSINVSRDKMTSDYDSVQEQSGIFAGSGGFDMTVGHHTQLDGGVIASTATADKNRLDTGTLGFSDIRNQADFKTEHQGAGISTGGSIGEQFAGNMANGLLAGGGNSGHAEATTQAAMSEGALIIRDKENQKQDVADLSRDAEYANGSISPIFDKEKEQQRLQEVQLIGEIGSQAVDIANTYGETEGLKAARDALSKEGVTEPDADASGALKKAYQDALRGTDAYKTTTAKYGTGSDLQRGIQAATAALQGLAGSDLKAALAGASAPELANYIGHGSGLSDEAAVVAHAILGGAVAALQGNSVAAGAAGAATGELAAKAIAGMLYPDVKDLSKLSEEQKQTVSTLATISAGMAGGIAGDSTASAAAGAQGGKNAVENNSLAGDQARAAAKQAAESLKNQVREKLGEGTTSSIANGIINALADTGDAALGSADYAADAAMALASCAAGDSYCSKAMSDLAGKNQAVADRVSAMMQSETWSAVADTVKEAADGNQAALEATGGLLAGIILPGKKIPTAGKLVDPTVKIATGSTVGAFEASLSRLPPRERVAIVKETVNKVIVEQGMVKDNKLTKLNNRDVYRGVDGNLYALDTQHGRFEVVSPKGKHLGEIDFSMQVRKPADSSGGHDLKVK